METGENVSGNDTIKKVILGFLGLAVVFILYKQFFAGSGKLAPPPAPPAQGAPTQGAAPPADGANPGDPNAPPAPPLTPIPPDQLRNFFVAPPLPPSASTKIAAAPKPTAVPANGPQAIQVGRPMPPGGGLLPLPGGSQFNPSAPRLPLPRALTAAEISALRRRQEIARLQAFERRRQQTADAAAAELKKSVILQGILLGPVNLAFASVNGSQQILHVGDPLPGDFVIDTIADDRVTVSRSRDGTRRQFVINVVRSVTNPTAQTPVPTSPPPAAPPGSSGGSTPAPGTPGPSPAIPATPGSTSPSAILAPKEATSEALLVAPDPAGP